MAPRIYIGDRDNPMYYFEDTEVESCPFVLTSSLSGEELAIDQFMPVVYEYSYIPVVFRPKNSVGLRTADGATFRTLASRIYFDKLPYGTPIWYYNGDNLIGKFYSQRIVRTGKAKFDVLAV